MSIHGGSIARATAAVFALALALYGCGGGEKTSGGTGGHGGGATASTSSGSSSGSSGGGSSTTSGSTSGSGGGGSTGSSSSGACSPDPLHTGLTAQQTGVSVDAFDCPVLTWTAHYNEPDAMVFKAIMYVESRFDDTAVACPNDPCGVPSGWTVAESGCFGLMQLVPACPGLPAGLLANGHPNLTMAPTASGWAGSIFNPNNNIEDGIGGIAGNRAQVEQQFPGCTVDQYTMMAVGNFNNYGSTKSCTEYNTAYDTLVIMAYQQYATAAGWPAHDYSAGSP
jgi:hypothetical protein